MDIHRSYFYYRRKRDDKEVEDAIWIHGKPKNVRCGNGTEFTSHKFTKKKKFL